MMTHLEQAYAYDIKVRREKRRCIGGWRQDSRSRHWRGGRV
jgi:hypothetical protein